VFYRGVSLTTALSIADVPVYGRQEELGNPIIISLSLYVTAE
jgi:hypothetical protein